MKKIIAILAMVALVGGVAFAEITVGGHVIGTVNLIEGSTAKGADDKTADPGASGGMNRVRVEASGTNEDETFGGWVRIEGGMSGYAWWKPADLLLLRVGSNGGDGFWGKEGVTGWMFYQTVTDTGVAFAGENVWGWHLNGEVPGFGSGLSTRCAFYGGFDNGLMLEIKPAEMFGINLALPFNNTAAEDFYKNIVIQADVNLDFGNIALTFDSGLGYKKAVAGTPANGQYYLDTNSGEIKFMGTPGVDGADEVEDPGKVYLYAGININENMAVDLGLGYTFPITKEDGIKVTYNAPIGIGAGFTFKTDALGVKLRLATALGGSVKPDGIDGIDIPLQLLADVQPYFIINDSATVFVSVGLVMTEKMTADKHGFDRDAVTAWHFNPYLQIGSEWGPKFLAGIKVWSQGDKDAKDNNYVNFAIPIAVNVGF